MIQYCIRWAVWCLLAPVALLASIVALPVTLLMWTTMWISTGESDKEVNPWLYFTMYWEYRPERKETLGGTYKVKF